MAAAHGKLTQVLPRSVVLLSGGLDSLVVWLMEPRRWPVFFALGQSYEQAEWLVVQRMRGLIAAAHPVLGRQFAPSAITRRLWLGDLTTDSGFLPCRNLLMASMAAALGARDIALGSTREDIHTDNTPAFRSTASALLSSLLDDDVVLTAPVYHLSKSAVIQWVRDTYPALLSAVQATRSCYHLEERHVTGPSEGCGHCRACQRRQAAWRAAGLGPVVYDAEVAGVSD